MLGKFLVAPILMGICITAVTKVSAEPKHGFAVLGKLKYPAGFSHFDYAEPEAPKGGQIILSYNGNYDNLNPFILKGRQAMGSNPFGVDGRLMTFETLMNASLDEPDSFYGLIAKSVEIAKDKSAITFNLSSAARFHDGSAITDQDVVFSYKTLKSKGHPIFRIIYKDIEQAEILAPGKVRFTFAANALKRDLPATIAGLPILSKAYYANVDFSKTTLVPPLASGPYRIDKIDAGRSISYERVKNYWGRELPINRGRYNFDRIKWIYFRDREIALEALFAGRLDFREEYTSRSWATKYNAPAVKDGRIKKQQLPDASPSGFQAFHFNSRRKKFANKEVRRALGLVFDFEWTNKNLFYGLYRRTYSMFQNSDLEAKGAPGPGELKLLESHRGKVPDEVFTKAYVPVKGDGSGRIRNRLRQARRILAAHGWKIKEGQLRDARGTQMTIEFISYSPAFERIIAPYVQNLKRLGIKSNFRLVEPAQYQKRLQTFDFDVVTLRNSGTLTPGISLRSGWHSSFADIQGGRNYAGVKNPVVDALIDSIMQARNREQLRDAARALDRVVMWNYYVTPQWFKAAHSIAYWDKFGRPKMKPKYQRGVLQYWWYDAAKAAKLAK